MRIQTAFGEKVRQHIREKQLTHQEFADRIGVSPGAIQCYINKGVIPKWCVALRIASELNITVNELMDGMPWPELEKRGYAERFFNYKKPEQTPMTGLFDVDEANQIKTWASGAGMSISELVRRAVRAYTKNKTPCVEQDTMPLEEYYTQITEEVYHAS